jgi:sialate O-acetylesterase
MALWGWSSWPHSEVTLVARLPHNSGGGNIIQRHVQAGADGSFRFVLGHLAAQTGVSIKLSDKDSSVTLDDVAVGDVVLCGGQSNMEFTLFGLPDAEEVIADSINYPGLRLWTTGYSSSWTPLDSISSKIPSYKWSRARPSAFVMEDDAQIPDVEQPPCTAAPNTCVWGSFSAVCYLTGLQVYKSLNKNGTGVVTVPIGLLADPWGGTVVETWSSPDALRQCNTEEENAEAEQVAQEIAERASHQEDDDAIAADDDDDDPPPFNSNSVLWNAMISPLLPMRFKFALWYQGESNMNNPANYACRFPAMIADWRLKFNLTLPFFFVQLAAYDGRMGGPTWPALQMAQLAALSLPSVGFASAMDLGDPTCPYDPIHPRIKGPLANRLANVVLKEVYGQNQLVVLGPAAHSAHVSSTASGRGIRSQSRGRHGASSNAGQTIVTLQLEVGAESEGLYFAGTAGCNLTNSAPPGGKTCCDVSPFVVHTSLNRTLRAVAPGKDSIIQAARQVRVLIDEPLQPGEQIDSLSYAYEQYTLCALYSRWSLPMTVFVMPLDSAAVRIEKAADDDSSNKESLVYA